jgi:phage-related tail protein
MCLLCHLSSQAQVSWCSPKGDEFQEFLKSTTIVPITGINSVDSTLREVLNEKWQVTKLKFVPIQDMLSYSVGKNVESNLLSILNIVTVSSLWSKRTSLTVFLPIEDPKDLGLNNLIASVPLR